MIWFGESSSLTGAMRSETCATSPDELDDMVPRSIAGAQPERSEAPDKADIPARRRNSRRFIKSCMVHIIFDLRPDNRERPGWLVESRPRSLQEDFVLRQCPLRWRSKWSRSP